MKTTTAFALALAPLLALAQPMAASAADDPLLAKFVGSWVGNGKIRQAPDVAEERIYCRITNTLTDDGKSLEQKGRCGVASNTTTVDGLITAVGGGRYEGTIKTLASKGGMTLEGTGTASRVELRGEFTDAQTGAPAVSLTVLTVSGDGYTMTSERRDDGIAPYAESNIVFKPQAQ